MLSDQWRVFLVDADVDADDEIVVGPALSKAEIMTVAHWLQQDGLLDILYAVNRGASDDDRTGA
jgi:hypothetical protein